MSTTTTTTAALTSTTLIGTLPTMASASPAPLVSGKSCPTCGQDEYLASADRVKDLQGQVDLLNAQATQTAEKLAAYETELRHLRAQSVRTGSSSTSLQTQTSPKSQPGRLSTLTSLLPSRRPSATSVPAVVSPPPQPPQPPQTSHEEAVELQNALTREQDLRKAAESQLSQASTELEELTAQLFSQANEMVAQERKARARLEERVAVLERRDVEKRSRLDRLEKAMERVERIRAMVG
ncbi:hypothetical protein BO70DRAFT_359264 [Aspergillus heteromorphus CBS 117.55]|uniref:GDP/GTP exchange factor Sec2 N-terminal domain-containing protein n=1 Tax=Aspergillus heteromorphus CBS 117.55 TaxID=1448321 RepID=A0A317WR77_9EURO|nr:uncharacterized protein BO70DRAFT_359264 [Aspergillus heteromorphus CBS 117.55]PWY88943.1 hypothetical protein BO70DRAFT_359264 [Aspergillus heteromorphus CBS 117.55]